MDNGDVSITITFNKHSLPTYTDSYLAMLWHLAQANPEDGFERKEPGELVAKIGWEIIGRWLRGVAPELHHHQQSHYHWKQLTKFAEYKPGDPEWADGTWVPRGPAGQDGAQAEG